MSRMLSVLHLRSSTGVYGAEQVLLNLLPKLRTQGVDCLLGCLLPVGASGPGLLEIAQERGLNVQRIECRGRIDRAAADSLRRWVQSYDPDLIHVHDYKSAAYAWAVGRGRWPIVTTVHGQCPGGLRVRLYNWLERRLARDSVHVCAVSPELGERLQQSGVAPQRISHVPNGIDTDRFKPADRDRARAGLGLAREGRWVGTAIRLAPEKRPFALLEALARSRHLGVPPVRLLIAGDGPLRPAIEARIDDLGLRPQVTLLGVHREMADLYPALDAFVLASEREGMPMALLEAMACGIPPVVTAVGGIPEVLEGLADGLSRMLPLGDESGLAQALATFSPPASSRGLLREHVEQRFGSTRMARQYAGIYADALRHRGRPFEQAGGVSA